MKGADLAAVIGLLLLLRLLPGRREAEWDVCCGGVCGAGFWLVSCSCIVLLVRRSLCVRVWRVCECGFVVKGN